MLSRGYSIESIKFQFPRKYQNKRRMFLYESLTLPLSVIAQSNEVTLIKTLIQQCYCIDRQYCLPSNLRIRLMNLYIDTTEMESVCLLKKDIAMVIKCCKKK